MVTFHNKVFIYIFSNESTNHKLTNWKILTLLIICIYFCSLLQGAHHYIKRHLRPQTRSFISHNISSHVPLLGTFPFILISMPKRYNESTYVYVNTEKMHILNSSCLCYHYNLHVHVN